MILTTFLVGYGVLRFLTRHLVYGADAYVMCGLVCVTVYAQFFSLFAGVGLWANVLLCAVCVGIFLRERRGIFERIKGCLPWGDGDAAKTGVKTCAGHLRWRNGKTEDVGRSKVHGWTGCIQFFAVIVLFLLFAYGTSRGISHYDTALYHAQSIRWIEEYGVVKGLGNLHCRLAYNSSSFALSALYSMAFLGKGSFHCAAGFLAFVLAAGCLRLVDSLRERKLRASDFARVMCVYYLVNIFDEMISPASDYFMVLIAFYLVITWLSLAEHGEREIFPYALLCVLAVFLLTVKLSAALILLLVIYPACRLVKEKRWKETGVCLGLGFVTALPFLIRNVVLSGWLIYPFTRINLFDVSWKIPKGVADYDAREIQVWGRGYSDVTRYDIAPNEWLPDWFRALAGSDKIFVLAAGLAVAVLLVWAVHEREQSFALLTVQGTVAASFLFWLCTSPLMRYGCVYAYLTPAVVFGGIYGAVMKAGGRRRKKALSVDGSVEQAVEDKEISNRKSDNGETRGHRIMSLFVCTAVVLLLAYKVFALGRGIVASHENKYWILQKGYENFDVESCEIEGVTFYYPVAGDRTGYDAFPAAPAKPRIAFLGDGLADGFWAVDPAVSSIRQ